MGGVVARRPFGGAVDAKVFDTLNSFIKTANKDGDATRGSYIGELLKSARRECKRVNNSANGTGVIVANEECMPFGGRHVAWLSATPHLVIAAPKSAPASSTDFGT